MRALVTGAAGFIGSHLAEALAARGDDVVGVDALTPYYDPATKRQHAVALEAAGCVFVEADLRSCDLAPMLDGVEVVFHQAAQPGVRLSWSDGFEAYVAHNVLATQRILEALRDRTVRFVYASSSSVYGVADRYPTTEEALPRPHSPYGVTKLAAEHLCALYGTNFGVETVALRYFTVFGPRQRPDMSIHRLCEAALGRQTFPRYGDGEQVRQFTYVDDIVAGNLAAADPSVPPGTVCNLAGGGEITLNALVDLVGALAGVAVPVDVHPAQPGDAPRNGGAIDRARTVLGWQPRVSLRDGLERQLAWHRTARP